MGHKAALSPETGKKKRKKRFGNGAILSQLAEYKRKKEEKEKKKNKEEEADGSRWPSTRLDR